VGAVLFYHLTQRPLADTLRTLLEKSLANGWRVAVRGTNATALAQLDEALWLGPKDGFLPHGLKGGTSDAMQPVLLQTDAGIVNGAVCVMAVQGAQVAPEEVGALERVCILFDGHDDAAVSEARGQWKALTGAGVAAQYWSEESGRWEKKAQSG